MQVQTAETVKQFISNVDAEGFLFVIEVNKTFTTCGDGYWSNVVKDVFVTSIGMYISTVNDEGYFGDGDLAVNYTEATWDNSVDGLIYTDRAFIAQVKATANSLLAPTDWMVLRKIERNIVIPTKIAEYRAAVVAATTANEIAIYCVTTVDELAALVIEWPEL